MKGAIDRARELADEIEGAWMPMQFDNPANVSVHEETTAREILEDFPDGLDALVTGVGTGGHLTGVARALKGRLPDLQVIAVEPAASAVLGGGEPGPHPIQGIGGGFIPNILDTALIDGVEAVEADESFRYALRCAREEGILVGISSGASLAAVAKRLPTLPAGARVLTFCYDTGERYLSVDGFQPADAPA